jgi:hypothetical protein
MGYCRPPKPFKRPLSDAIWPPQQTHRLVIETALRLDDPTWLIHPLKFPDLHRFVPNRSRINKFF